MLEKIAKNQFDPKIYIGKEIGNITLMSLLGQGAMGAVFIGYQKSLKRKVAVKIFPKKVPDSNKMRLRFRDEAETVAVLNHPNIVPVFDMNETDDFLYIIMQLIEGEDLRSFIHRFQLHPVPSRRTIPLQTSIQIMARILDALQYAHEESVIHRDIKPANIILENRSNRPYLADFGIAQSTMSEDTQSQMVVGTPLYIAPEQIWGHATCRSDIYACGIVLFELIAGKLPLTKSSLDEVLKIKMYEPDKLFSCTPSQTAAMIDKDLEKIILQAIATDPEMRYIDCKLFYNDLVTFFEHTFPGAKL